MMYLLDTNVLSEMRKLNSFKINPNVATWLNRVYPEELYLSVLTIMEIKVGILGLKHRNDYQQTTVLNSWLTQEIQPKFAQRILPITTEIALSCASLHIPNKRPFSDALIAATAIQHNLTLVTRNIKDFQGLKLRLINPFEADLG